MKVASGALAVALVIVLAGAGLYAGAIVARLTTPAGSGLAGGSTAAIYVLMGLLAGAITGGVVAWVLPQQRYLAATGVAVAVAASLYVAMRATPVATLPPPPPPPPQFEPEFTMALFGDLDAEPLSADPLDLPFRRLDVSSRAGLRRIARGASRTCTGPTPSFERLESVLVAARAVYGACSGAESDCAESAVCPDCKAYSFALFEARQAAPWLELSGEYLATDSLGRRLVDELSTVYQTAQADWYCGP